MRRISIIEAALMLCVVLAASLLFAPVVRAEDDAVHCSINETSFWTTHSICDQVLAEASLMIRKSGSMSRDGMLHLCASDMEKNGLDKYSFPQRMRIHLNGCCS